VRNGPPPDGNARLDAGSDPELDAELEGRLRVAFGSMAPPGAPESLLKAASRIADSPVVRARIPIGRRSTLGWAAIVLVLSAVALGSLLPAGSGPAPTGPASPPTSAVASGLASAPSPAACVESPATLHGTWWREIGGPEAFFNWDSGARPAGNRWLLIVRFDPDAVTSDQLSVWADDLGSGERAQAVFNSTMDPSAIYRFDTPAPDLPGGWFLFEQPLPTAGCWRLSAAIDGRIVGTAMVEIGPVDLSPSPDPKVGPTPAIAPDET